MSISVNGQSQVPPGFRFHPTEEELLQYYLKKKVASEKIDLDVIQDVDLNKLEPWDIQEKCKIGSNTPQNDWYFFSHKDKKYPTGTRTNRATASGFWKATGRDKVIYGNSRRIGMRKTLVFYKGRAPRGQKSDWIMHEYRLDDNTTTVSCDTRNIVCNAIGDQGMQEEGWVVCRVFKKKHHSHKTLTDSPAITTTNWSITTINSCNHDDDDEGTLEQMFHYSMGDAAHTNNNNNKRFVMKLPSLHDTSNYSTSYQLPQIADQPGYSINYHHSTEIIGNNNIQDWAALDRLVASHLNGNNPADELVDQIQQQRPSPSSSSSTRVPYAAAIDDDHHQENECDIWNDHFCHLSNLPV